MASNTDSSSPGELEMTPSTSLVAVCCSSASLKSSVRWRSSLSRRVFSMAMTACLALIGNQLDLLVVERPHLLPVDVDCPDHLVLFQHRHAQEAPKTGKLYGANEQGIALDVGFVGHDVGDLHHLLCSQYPAKAYRLAPAIVGKCRRRVLQRSRPE